MASPPKTLAQQGKPVFDRLGKIFSGPGPQVQITPDIPHTTFMQQGKPVFDRLKHFFSGTGTDSKSQSIFSDTFFKTDEFKSSWSIFIFVFLVFKFLLDLILLFFFPPSITT